MNSIDYLDLLMSNQKKVKDGFKFLNLKTKEQATIEDCYETIKKDLEILEMLKKNMSTEIGYYDSDFGCEAYEYIAYNNVALHIETQEELDLLKEWLRNAK